MPELVELIAHSKTNEAIARKLFEIETEVLACKTSEELLTRLFNSIKNKFNIDGITLIMAEPTPISYMLSSSMQSTWHKTNTQTISQMRLEYLHPANKPLLTNDFESLKQQLVFVLAAFQPAYYRKSFRIRVELPRISFVSFQLKAN